MNHGKLEIHNKYYPFYPQVSDMDSSISDFGHIHCCNLQTGFQSNSITEMQTVNILMRRLIMRYLYWSAGMKELNPKYADVFLIFP